jgi:acyl-CoA thioesterase FadM
LYGDPLVIQLWVRMSSAPKWTFIYHIMHDETKRIHAKASTTHVYVNEEGKLLLTHPDWFWKRVSEVAAKHPGLYLEST